MDFQNSYLPAGMIPTGTVPGGIAAIGLMDVLLLLPLSVFSQFVNQISFAAPDAYCAAVKCLMHPYKNNYGTTPVVHLTCLQYDREEIRRLLDQLEEAGIDKVLVLVFS